MKKELTIDELNKKIEKIEKFKKKGLPILEGITFSVVGATLATMIAVAILQAGAGFLIGMTSALLAMGGTYGFLAATNYDKKIRDIKKQIRKLEGKKSVAKTAKVTKVAQKENMLVRASKAAKDVSKTKTAGENKVSKTAVKAPVATKKQNAIQGYSRTKAIKVYVQKSKEQNEEIQNSLN